MPPFRPLLLAAILASLPGAGFAAPGTAAGAPVATSESAPPPIVSTPMSPPVPVATSGMTAQAGKPAARAPKRGTQPARPAADSARRPAAIDTTPLPAPDTDSMIGDWFPDTGARAPVFPTDSTRTMRPGPSPGRAALFSAIAPGSGQFLTGHPVRGSFLVGLELWLYGDAASRTFTGIPARDRSIRRLRARIDSLGGVTDSAEAVVAKAAARSARIELRDELEKRAISRDLRNSELAWALGLHVYAVVDAAEAAWRRNHPPPLDRSPAGAAWRSALIPGWGQVYNGRYAKASMLYMAIGGAVASGFSRQEVVDFYKDREREAWLTEDSTTARVVSADAIEQADQFRKRRNQYIWGLGLLYAYQIFDAIVDARLAALSAPFPIALRPTSGFQGMEVAWTF